jgi:hypothetical protein
MNDLQKRNSALELVNQQFRAFDASHSNPQPEQLLGSQNILPLGQRTRNNRNKNKQPRRPTQPSPQALSTAQQSTTSSTAATTSSTAQPSSTATTSKSATSTTNGNSPTNILTAVAVSESEDTEQEGEDLTLEQAAQAAAKIARARIFYIHSLRKSPDGGSRKKWDSVKMKEECLRLHVRFSGTHLHKLATRLAKAAHK